MPIPAKTAEIEGSKGKICSLSNMVLFVNQEPEVRSKRVSLARKAGTLN
jgi:hypothetical protein